MEFRAFFETIESTYVVGRGALGAVPSNPQRRWRLAAKSASLIYKRRNHQISQNLSTDTFFSYVTIEGKWKKEKGW